MHPGTYYSVWVRIVTFINVYFNVKMYNAKGVITQCIVYSYYFKQNILRIRYFNFETNC